MSNDEYGFQRHSDRRREHTPEPKVEPSPADRERLIVHLSCRTCSGLIRQAVRGPGVKYCRLDCDPNSHNRFN